METHTPKAVIGQPAPDFLMPSTRNMETLEEPVRLADYRDRWLVMVFYPLDFTYVCPTELRGFNEKLASFNAEGAEILGVSTDSVYTHRAWIKTPRDRGGLGEIGFPLASDPTHEVSREYGALAPGKGHTFRATFMIDPDSVLRYSVLVDLDVGRSVEETLRTLQALKTGGLCPANWRRGEAMLRAA